MPVVIGLDAASAGNVVSAGCDFQVAAVGEVAYHLNQSFAEGSCSYYHRTVHILKASANDFGRGGRPAIYHYNQRHYGVYRFHSGVEVAVGAGHFSFGIYHFLPFGDEQVGDIYRFVQRASWIVAQVQNQSVRSLFFQFQKCLPHLLACAVGKTGQADISHTGLQQAIVGHLRHPDGFACNLEGKRLFLSGTFYFQLKGGAGFAT